MYFPIIDVLKENFIAKIPAIVTQWLTDNVDPVGSAVVVDESLSISGAAADAKITGDEISDLKSDISNVYVELNGENIVDVDAENESHSGATLAVSYPQEDLFVITPDSSANGVVGYKFNTTIGKEYLVKFNSESADAYTISIVKNNSYSSTTYLYKDTNVTTGAYQFTFTATTAITTIWFYVTSRSTTNQITIENLSIVDASTVGWMYGSLDNTFTSDRYPPSGKVVGDAFIEVPSSEWLGYNNLFQITQADLVTDNVPTGGSISRTIDGNTITITTSGNNARTSYKLNGLEIGTKYKFEFESDTDFTQSNLYARITTDATASAIGNLYAEFDKSGEKYSCVFTACDFTLCLAISTAYNSGTVVLGNIQIRKAKIIEDEYCNYKGQDITTFNKCLCIGDSLTYGGFNANNVDPDVGIDALAEKYSYPTYLNKITGIETVKKAIGGLTSVGWWNRYGSDDLSGFDMAIIQLGVNDASPSKLNGWTQESIDAYTNIINKLKTENTNIKIFVATTVPAPAFVSSKINEVNSGIRQLVSDINDENVVLADINSYGHTADTSGYSAGHLTAYGYNRLALDYVALISYLMHTEPQKYRFVQFIGTSYTYTE